MTAMLKTLFSVSMFSGLIASKRIVTKSIAVALILSTSLLLTLNATAQTKKQIAGQAQPTLPLVNLTLGDTDLRTEVASTPDQRYMGLSFRKTLGENEAMLFVYQKEQPLIFTMRNTLLPLSIAYISKDFVINEIHDMPVGENLLFPSKLPAMFALEVNQGWFERNNIKAGYQIKMNP